jgi:hypothetical protein
LYEGSSFNQQPISLDGALLYFGTNYSNSVDSNDAKKLTNLDETISVLVDNTNLSIASFQSPQINTIYPLNFTSYRYSNYTLIAKLNNYNGITPYIHDKFTQTYTEVNPIVNYNFSVDVANSASTAYDRFEIVYNTEALHTDDFNVDSVNLFPNPSSSNYFNLQLPLDTSNYTVKVYNSLGQLLDVELNAIENNVINCKVPENLATGMYQIEISKDSKNIVKKWIKS